MREAVAFVLGLWLAGTIAAVMFFDHVHQNAAALQVIQAVCPSVVQAVLESQKPQQQPAVAPAKKK